MYCRDDLTQSVAGSLLLDGLLKGGWTCGASLGRAGTLLQLHLVPSVRVEMHQVLLLDVKLQVNVGTEALPAMETEERGLTGVRYQMMLQTNRNLEGSVALRANLVLSTALGVHEMTETVEHDLIPPAKLPITLTTGNLSSGGSFVPVHPPHQTLSDVELVVHLPLLQLALLPLLVHHPGHPLVVLHFLDPHLLRQLFSLVLGEEFSLLLDLLGMVL